ncbi:very short patch repair endonuclease [Thermodesulfobacteriota bacterium B35]
MVDFLSRKHRSWNMSRIKSRDTKPEMLVRSLLHRKGYRFRLHKKDLPGKPDIVLPRFRKIIFVHGCFWHRHPNCKFAYTPKSHTEFWEKKFTDNIKRDQQAVNSLRKMGWSVHIIWECETKRIDYLSQRLDEIMEIDRPK